MSKDDQWRPAQNLSSWSEMAFVRYAQFSARPVYLLQRLMASRPG